jgi:hypothetical protein
MELRATIRDGRLILAPLDNVLVEGGPLAVYARAVVPDDVALADVAFDEEAEADEREVEVAFLANDNPRARSVIKRWATATGHARVWFSDEVHEIDPADAPVGQATAQCGHCDLELTDGTGDFWEMVRSCGIFPPFCFSCGATIPQWSTDPVKPRRGRLELVRDTPAGFR